MPTSYTPDGERNGVSTMFTFARGQLPYARGFYADTSCTSREKYEGPVLPTTDEQVRELVRYQTMMAVNAYCTPEEAVGKTFARNGLQAEAIMAYTLKPLDWQLPPAKKQQKQQKIDYARAFVGFKAMVLKTAQEQRREERQRDNEERRRAFLAAYDGNAQPLPHLYGHLDDSEDEDATTAYWLQPVSAPASPDLFCYETIAERDPDVEPSSDEESDNEVFAVEQQQKKQRSHSTASTRSLVSTPHQTTDVIVISDAEDEGLGTSVAVDSEGEEDCTTVALHEEKLKTRRIVRAAHLSIRAMQQLCEDEDYAMQGHNGRLERLKEELATRKRKYDEQKQRCADYEECVERKRAAREAFTACLEATQSKLSTREKQLLRRRGQTSTAWNF